MSGMKAKMIYFEKMVDENCNIEYMNTDGTEIVKTSKASLMIAFEEYLKLYKSERNEAETSEVNLNIGVVMWRFHTEKHDIIYYQAFDNFDEYMVVEKKTELSVFRGSLDRCMKWTIQHNKQNAT